ncbi:MAG TPA: hypothetical protein VJ984_06250 [Xanthomonadales bacterium]|nr:hypothetical protein [Xanthomonadales bacterium]
MTIHRIYSLTSIGRPVDIKYATNRYMLLLLVPTAIAALIIAYLHERGGLDMLIYALSAILAGFGSWALGRELAPDDQAAAFAGMVLAVIVMLVSGPASTTYGLLVMFVTLGLVRQVNRTTGLEARLTDSLLLTALSIWVIYSTGNALFGVVAAVSFAMDGYLAKPLRRQWLYALIMAVAVIVYMVDHESSQKLYSLPDTLSKWVVVLIAFVFALNLLLKKNVTSVTDVGRKKLDVSRVRGGMLVALLVLIAGLSATYDIGLVAASAAGVCLASAIRRSFTNPV